MNFVFFYKSILKSLNFLQKRKNTEGPLYIYEKYLTSNFNNKTNHFL
jgi:hypothetical protein